MRLLAGLVALVAGCTIAAPSASAQDRIALVIGNNRYLNLPTDKQLAKAVNDARAVGDALEKLGFKVIRGENLNRAQMVDRVFTFTQAIKPGDIALTFFAGHGVSLSGGNYLLPTDIPLPRQGEENRARNMALGEADIVADIQERKPRVVVMLLDACRDNPFRQPGLTRSIGGETGLSRGREAEGVFSVYSAGFGQSALDRLGPDDASPNSIFTRALVPALSRSDTHLADIVIDIREEVARLAATIGHQQYPAYYDQTRGGRVYLSSPPPTSISAPTRANQPLSSNLLLPPGANTGGRIYTHSCQDGKCWIGLVGKTERLPISEAWETDILLRRWNVDSDQKPTSGIASESKLQNIMVVCNDTWPQINFDGKLFELNSTKYASDNFFPSKTEKENYELWWAVCKGQFLKYSSAK